ncbi:MAG: uroporphyrinogen-III synthase [Actinomycetota bacterium]
MTVAVTTTRAAYPRWSGPLRQEGLDPVSLPCIEIRPTGRLREARQEAAAADWLVLTSPRAVSVLWPEGGMPPVPAAVVGGGTARAVRQAGGEVALVGDGDGRRLAQVLGGRVSGGTLLFLHGTRADAGRFSGLAGVDVRAMAVYETIPLPPAPDPVDGAVFGSPSAVEGWTMSRTLGDLAVVAAMGPVTARALHGLGVDDVVTPPRPGIESVARTLSATLEMTR